MSDDQLTIDALMARIEAEVARRRTMPIATRPERSEPYAAVAAPFAAAATGATAVVQPLPRPAAPSVVIPKRNAYAMAELLSAQDSDFVDGAFRAILRRPADPASIAHFLGKLRSGEFGKVDVLGRLRYSPEGRARGVPVAGLLPAFVLSHARTLPVVGPLVGFGIAVLRLPALTRGFQRLESHVVAREREVAAESVVLIEQIERGLAALRQSMDTAEQRAGSALASESTRLRQDLGDLEAAVAALLRQTEAIRSAAAWQSDLDRATERVGTLERVAGDIAPLASRVDALDQAVHAERARQAGIAEQLAAATKTIAGRLDAAFHVAEERATAAQTFAATLAAERAARAAIDARIEDLDVAVTRVVGQSNAAARAAIEATRDVEAKLSARIEMLLAEQRGDAARAASEAAREVEAGLSARVEALSSALQAARAGADALASASQSGLDTVRAELVRHRGALAALERRLAGPSDTLGAAAVTKPSVGSRRGPARRQSGQVLDTFYAEFEDRFRGSREVVRARARGYLPFLGPAGAGLTDAPILDLGCGRGEWLELLRDEQRVATGVDLNEVFIAGCRERGLEVESADAVEALRRRATNSLGAVTAMHLVEHLPFEAMVALVDEAHRVLRPGGVMILETPNPENLLVAALSFYYDPTHRNPVPPLLLEHLVAARGFAAVEVLRLADNRSFVPPQPLPSEAPGAASVNFLLAQFSAAPDYAVVARKP